MKRIIFTLIFISGTSLWAQSSSSTKVDSKKDPGLKKGLSTTDGFAKITAVTGPTEELTDKEKYTPNGNAYDKPKQPNSGSQGSGNSEGSSQ